MLTIGAEGGSPFLELLTARLATRHYFSAVVGISKPTDRQAFPTALLAELAQRCDVVLTGVCLTVDAAAYTALDAAALEQLSVPCAVVATADVADGVREELIALGYDGGAAVVQTLVQDSCRDVERVLTAGRGAGQQEPGQRFPRTGEVTCEC